MSLFIGAAVFVGGGGAGQVLGVFPWCLFSLLLREAYLDFASMRVVIPVVGVANRGSYCYHPYYYLLHFYLYVITITIIHQLGTVMVVRAVLGSGFLIKTAFSLQYLFDLRFETREVIGRANCYCILQCAGSSSWPCWE